MKKYGKGIAAMFYQTHAPISNPSGAYIELQPDGTVRLAIGAADIGQGSTTALTQIASEELGIPLELFSVQTADTETTPYCAGTYGNRVTYVCGNAVKLAASEVKKKILTNASIMSGLEMDKLDIKNAVVICPDSPEVSIAVGDVAGFSTFVKGETILGSASFSPVVKPLDPETGQGAPSVSYVFGVHVAEVEVDTDTGEVKVLKMYAAHDVGRAINLNLLEAQIEGGIQMGLGYALMEEIKMDNKGNVRNPNFTDYLMPTSMDVPEIQSFIIETDDPTGPFGAKAIGEAATCPTAPAIINAIYDATGVLVKEMPATPENVWRALNKKQIEAR